MFMPALRTALRIARARLLLMTNDRPEDPLCAALTAVPRRGPRRGAGATGADRRDPAGAPQISRAHHARPEESGAGEERARAKGRLPPVAAAGRNLVRRGGAVDRRADRARVLRQRQLLCAVRRL